MAAEVIDLLSSSPVLSRSEIDGIASAATAKTTPAKTCQVTQSHHSDFSSSFPDIDKFGFIEEIDLSGGGNSIAAPRRDPPLPPPSQQALPNGAIQTSNADVLFLSDDFDTTGDLDVQASKRPKFSSSFRRSRSEVISQPPSSLNRPSESILSRRSPRQAQNRDRLTHNDIQSSDPFATSPPKVPNFEEPPRSAQPQSITTANTVWSLKELPRSAQPLPILSSDPFSSPPRASRARASPRSYLPPDRVTASSISRAVAGKKPADAIDLTSDVEEISVSAPTRKPTTSKHRAAWDPISSSMPEARHRGSSLDPSPRHGNQIINTNRVHELSDSDSDVLPELANISRAQAKAHLLATSKASEPEKIKGRVTTTSKKSAEAKDREKKTKADAREEERERKKLEKEEAKKSKAAEKVKQKALEEVNKKRTNHKVSAPEMIVDLPDSLRPALKVQVETLLDDLSVEFHHYHSTTENVVRWRRKVIAVFDAEEGIWKDVQPRITPEEHVLVILEAPVFVKLALGMDGETLEQHVARVRSITPNSTVIYLIEGLTAWMRKNRNIRNRQYVNNVRAEASEPVPTQSRKRKAPAQEYVDEDTIEDALLELQVLHCALIHHTGAMVETAQWVSIFTQHISTVPYRRAQTDNADAGFCMEAGQVRTGADAKDTYVRMLQEIGRITAPIAYGIAAEFPTLAELMQALETRGPMVLADCRKSANQDGAFSDRKIGQAVSKRVHKIFTGRDPGSTDV